MKKYVIGLLILLSIFASGCGPSQPKLQLRYDGIHKIPNDYGESFTYVYVLDERKLKWLSHFRGTEQEAVDLLLTPDKVQPRSYYDGDDDIGMSLRSGSVVGHGKINKQVGGTFQDATFLRIENGRIIERISSGTHLPIAYLMNSHGKLVFEDGFEGMSILSDRYIKVKKNDLYGILDFNGSIVLPIEYEFIGKLSEGLIRLRKKDEFGFADKDFNIIIKPQFQAARDFNQGVAAIQKNDKWYFINTENKLVNKDGFDNIENYASKALIPVKIDRDKNQFWNFLNLDKNEIYEFAASNFNLWKALGYMTISDGKNQILLGKDGKPVIPYTFAYIYPVDSKRFIVTVKENQGVMVVKGKQGVVNEKGEQVIPIQFADVGVNVVTGAQVGEFKDGEKVLFSATMSDQKNNKGVFDYWGKLITPFQFDTFNHLKDDYILASSSDFYRSASPNKSAIYKVGNPEPVFSADKIKAYGDGYVAYLEGKEWGIADINGKTIVKPDYSGISYVSNNLFIAQDEEEYGILDFKGNELVDFDNLMISHTNGMFRFYDRKIDIIIDDNPASLSLYNNQIQKLLKKGYLGIYAATEKVAIVKDDNGKKGVVDFEGNVIIPVIYKYVDYYPHYKYFLVKEDRSPNTKK